MNVVSKQLNLTTTMLMVVMSALFVINADAIPNIPKLEPDQVAPSYRRKVDGVEIKEHLNVQMPLDLEFTDHNNKPVKLGDYYKDGKPVIINLVYYGCPGLCTVSLNGMCDGLKRTKMTPGTEYRVVVVSFDSREHPTTAGNNPELKTDEQRSMARLAAADMVKSKRQSYLDQYGIKPSSEDGFVFLTGSEASVVKLTELLGFQYKWDEKSKQYMHGAALVMTTPEGVTARYLYGGYTAGSVLRLSIVEAANRQVGSLVDQIRLYCTAYNAESQQYVVIAMQLVKIGGLVTMLGLLTAFVVIYIYEKKRAAKRALAKVAGAGLPA